MKKVLIYYYFSCVAVFCYAQEKVVWGSKIIEVSSEFSRREYSSEYALKRYDAYAIGKDSTFAWRPKKSMSNEEFIVIGFDNPLKAKQIIIVETENPGAVTGIYGYDTDYNEYLLLDVTPRDLQIESRVLNLFFEQTDYELQAVKVVLDCSVSEGYSAIDAVAISESDLPFNVMMELANDIKNDINPERLGDNINSEYRELGAIISPDGKRIYFSRQLHPDNVGGVKDTEDIWVSEYDEESGQWLPAKNVGPPLNTPGPNFVCSINIINGKEVLILGNTYDKEGKMAPGVSLTEKTPTGYTDPVAINLKNAQNNSLNADFYMTRNGDALILSIEKHDIHGHRDLYVSFPKNDKLTSWSEPVNMGTVINTSGDESAPFMSKDGEKLYFSSNGNQGYGGKDIYVSERLDDTWMNWSNPKNMGSSINTEGDDEYLYVHEAGDHIYFSREQDKGNSDIFTVKPSDLYQWTVKVIGKVINAKTKEPIIGAKLIITKHSDDVSIAEMVSDKEGNYSLEVDAGEKYVITSELDGYISKSKNLTLKKRKANYTVSKDIMMMPVEIEKDIRDNIINNILFDWNKWNIKDSYQPELIIILNYMKEGKIQKLIIEGHTDSTGKEQYNMTLSQKRAKAVRSFFVKNGISEERIEIKAFGEARPAFNNNRAENRRKNRRTELLFEISTH